MQTEFPWQQDPVLMQAKEDGRVTLDSAGAVVILDRAPPTPVYAVARSLDVSWTGLMQEPPRIGTDDRGKWYTDYNYSLFCGAGAGAAALYYWPNSHVMVTTTAGTFTEPVNLGTNRHASTYWASEDSGGYGRGMIMYLAEVEWPTMDQGKIWWKHPGLMDWSAVPRPATEVANLIDAINWEASGRARLGYFYVALHSNQLTSMSLKRYIHSDISMGVPLVIAARTSDGKVALPHWRVKAVRSTINHFVTVVGYDDVADTYTIIDTCGLQCNDKNIRAGVGTITQAALYNLIRAESDNDGIMW